MLRCINGDMLSVRMGKLLSHFERTITWEREKKKEDENGDNEMTHNCYATFHSQHPTVCLKMEAEQEFYLKRLETMNI